LFCGCGIHAAKQDPRDAPGKLSDKDEGFGRAAYGNPGLFGADGIIDPARQRLGLNSGLANGRLAMFATMGVMFQNGVTSTTGQEMWAPLAAFEQELGVQAPVGFLDPPRASARMVT